MAIDANQYGTGPYAAYAAYLKAGGVHPELGTAYASMPYSVEQIAQFIRADGDFQDVATNWWNDNGGAAQFNPNAGVTAAPTRPMYGGGSEDAFNQFSESASDYNNAVQMLPQGYGFVGGGNAAVNDPSQIYKYTAEDGNTYNITANSNYQQPNNSFLDNVAEFVGNAGPMAIPSLIIPGFGALSLTGNSMLDTAIKGALQSAASGGDPLQGALTSGLISQVTPLLPSFGSADSSAWVSGESLPTGGDPMDALRMAVTNSTPSVANGWKYEDGEWVEDWSRLGQPLPANYFNMTADAGTMSDAPPANAGSYQTGNFADSMAPAPFSTPQPSPGFDDAGNFSLGTGITGDMSTISNALGTGGSGMSLFDDLLNSLYGQSTGNFSDSMTPPPFSAPTPEPGFDPNGNFSLGTGVTGDMSTVNNALGNTVTDRSLLDAVLGVSGGVGPLAGGASNQNFLDSLRTAMGAAGGASGVSSAIRNLFGSGASGGAQGASGGVLGGLSSLLGGNQNSALLTALLGGVLGSQSGAKQSGTITNVQDVPEWMKPYYQNLYNTAQTQATEANALNPQEQQGIDALTQRATAGSPVMGAASAELQKTINGDYLDPATNPYLQATYDRGLAGVKKALTPSFGQMQAFGQNSGYNQALARGAADLGTGIFGGNYQQERTRQASAANQAPTFAAADYNDATQLLNAGQYKRNAKQQGTQFMSGVLNGSPFKSSSQPYYTNPTAGILGGALTGAAIGKGIFGS